MEGIQCSEFTFFNDFDSANLSRVEYVPPNESVVTKQPGNKSVIPEIPDAEFNIWTKPDCSGTEWENGNRTWFYFGMKANNPSLLIKFNLVDLNRQGKMYSQGMAPVFRIVPGKPQWERIRDRPTYSINDNIFTLSFKFRTPENVQSIMYFAFTYPFTYVELEKMFLTIDKRFTNVQPTCEDDIYYVRETVCQSLDGRNIDLITISSYHGMTDKREDRLKQLFPDEKVARPFKFDEKKVIFISARVHPGETPSSFVFNGLINQLLCRDDLIAIHLRKLYVFKLIPFLNPDGVARGHYRTDTRGVNLNRVYMQPDFKEHPSVYAARALIRYYHYGFEKEDVIITCDKCELLNQIDKESKEDQNNVHNDKISKKVSHMTLEEGDKKPALWCGKCDQFCRQCGEKIEEEIETSKVTCHGDFTTMESGLFLYMDLHGHASKKGIFMYGNYFEDTEKSVECMLLPKLMSINNHNFHFNSCNFTERNMFLKDKRDGMSRAGSGRVSVLALTGLIRSYTLECNYNTGRLTNILPPTIREPSEKVHSLPVPPKYTPLIFEEVGKSLCSSILDLTGDNPMSRICNSEFRSLSGLRNWLAIQYHQEMLDKRHKPKMTRKTCSLQNQGKSKLRPPLAKTVAKKVISKARNPILPIERKENILAQPSTSFSSNNKQSLRQNKFGLKSKSRKDLTLKSKNASSEKLKATTMRQKSKSANAKLTGIEEDDKSKGDMQIREICFIKNNEGKTLIAKYKKANKEDPEENLVVTWGPSTNATIYTQKGKINASKFGASQSCEPGTSKQQGPVRIHNFAKSPSFFKSKKHSLRRLSGAESLTKIEKKKKKKMKSK
ncbi:unnamed protein product [Brassicogethes aeneus]|uniref:tubulin-glutamate carboxypeptidase n=1 Tax=Brassicogethes aeneus TaxID=1431903 RepID=A0A9P0B1W7_BRAAE|nr:unnamed protein product [Brassicogethes aeneus]